MLRVLVVSTRDLTRDLSGTVLWAAGIERLMSRSPAAAVKAAMSFKPSLVVVDACDGIPPLVVVRRLRASPGARRSSIVVAGAPDAASEEEFVKAGASLVLRSGTDAAECNDTLLELLKLPHRVRTSLDVLFSIRERGKGGWVGGRVLDASIGGILVEAPEAPEAGQTVDLGLQLPYGSELRAVGQTVRVEPGSPTRFALRLIGFQEDGQRRIREMVRQAPQRCFGRYEVLGLLGEGAMGRVYRVYDPLARRVVALKTLRAERLEGSQAEDDRRRFRREAQAAARLVHPNIITIFDVADGYFVMELLEGATLQALLAERACLDPEETRRLLGPVAEALDYAHGEGTIHRDIKPANILVTTDGRPKVMDFGVAHLRSGAITAVGEVFGSPYYMAPEQIASGEVGPHTDLFSFAVVVYETLTGRRPFEGDSLSPIFHSILDLDATPPSRLNPALPSSYDAVFRRALAKTPHQRFPSAAAFMAALDPGAPLPVPASLAAEEPVLATVDLKTRAAEAAWGPFLRRRRWVAAAALAVTLGTVAVGMRLNGASGVRTAPAPPGLQVASLPPGATVTVDGEPLGITPLYLTNLAGGPRALRVAAEGHAPAELTVDVSSEGPPVPLRFDLQPLYSGLQVESDPAGAKLDVDGEPAGTTPLSGLRVPAGTRRIQLTKRCFRPWARVVDARPGETLEVAARLEAASDMRSRDALRRQGWVVFGDLVELSPSVTPPRRLAGPPPAYPAAARKLLLRGTVTVEQTVTETGAVTDVRVVQSAGEILDHALLEAAATWRYEPAETNGVKVKVRIRESQAFEPDA